MATWSNKVSKEWSGQKNGTMAGCPAALESGLPLMVNVNALCPCSSTFSVCSREVLLCMGAVQGFTEPVLVNEDNQKQPKYPSTRMASAELSINMAGKPSHHLYFNGAGSPSHRDVWRPVRYAQRDVCYYI